MESLWIDALDYIRSLCGRACARNSLYWIHIYVWFQTSNITRIVRLTHSPYYTLQGCYFIDIENVIGGANQRIYFNINQCTKLLYCSGCLNMQTIRSNKIKQISFLCLNNGSWINIVLLYCFCVSRSRPSRSLALLVDYVHCQCLYIIHNSDVCVNNILASM